MGMEGACDVTYPSHKKPILPDKFLVIKPSTKNLSSFIFKTCMHELLLFSVYAKPLANSYWICY